MDQYIVKWFKYFVNGNLKGLTVDSELKFIDLDQASRFVAYLHKHSVNPVESLDSSNYTCHMARIERK